MNITPAVLSVLGAAIAVIAAWFGSLLAKGKVYRLIEEFAWVVVSGLEQRGLKDPLLATGQAKLEEAIKVVGWYASRFGLNVKSAEVAAFIRATIENAVFRLNTQYVFNSPRVTEHEISLQEVTAHDDIPS